MCRVLSTVDYEGIFNASHEQCNDRQSGKFTRLQYKFTRMGHGTVKRQVWRLLDTGKLSAADNIALDEALLEARASGNSPDTVRFLQFSPPAALLGYNQSLLQEIRVSYCKERKIDVNRRITGGGAIFFDESQLGWEIICEKTAFDCGIAGPHLFKMLSKPVIHALGKMGINAAFRPRNDIEVRGRKISGTGGTEEGKAFFFQGTLLVDFDVDTMFRVLRVPVEKLKDKEIESAKDRVTCLRWELGSAPGLEELKKLLRESFEEIFNIHLIPDGLTELECSLFEKKRDKFASESYIDRVKLPPSDQPIIHSLIRTRGGIIRTSLMINITKRRIHSLMITGDFFAYPGRTILDLEAKLKDVPTDRTIIEGLVTRFFKQSHCYIPGVTPLDFVSSIVNALEKVKIVEFGIPLSWVNNIFTVRGHFPDLVRTSPRHLLLPYCAKSISCSFRYEKDCDECGECTVGEAYRLGKERNMDVITITSFEDLMETLKWLKSENARSYIGCCCETFYRKHLEDFECSSLPGILIDIDDTTCYDLGKEQLAYRGKFESQTHLNIDLLKKVCDAVL